MMYQDLGLKELLSLILVFVPSLWFVTLAMPVNSQTQVQTNCSGCLCPGDPCGLCPLPAMAGETQKANESETCARIRARVPPTSAQPGSNEYFPNLDKSTMVCISEGGDVIRNRERSEEFPSRFYCKPPNSIN